MRPQVARTICNHIYPPEMQEVYFKTHKKLAPAEFSRSAAIRKGIAILVFAAVLAIMAKVSVRGLCISRR
ncbi:MAG: hypothetical protein IJ571_08095 [Ruminococcus sp.]|nr:hypothetical protein [Ruminococcus sp.]